MRIIYKILAGLAALLSFVAAIFSAGYFKRGERQANKNTEVLNDVNDATKQAEIDSRKDLDNVKKQTDNSDFSDLSD